MSDSATFLSWKFNTLSFQDKYAIGMVIDELAKARAKHPDYPNDIVHRAAIVAEESGELVRASINSYYANGPIAAVQIEAMQTAATAVRLLSASIPTLTPQTPKE